MFVMHGNVNLLENCEASQIMALKDPELERLLELVRSGDETARDQLSAWAYLTAFTYYKTQVSTEKNLTPEDAEDLTTAFFLEFERKLPRVQSATRYTRFVLKQNLKRFLWRKRIRRFRERWLSLNQPIQDEIPAAESEPAWMAWSDEDFLQYQAVLEALKQTDDCTRQVIKLRMQDPPVPYREIATVIQASETAIRMRVTRFYSEVRNIYVTASKRRSLYRL